MPASYPNSFWPGNVRGAKLNQADVHTKWHDDIAAEVMAMQAEGGLQPRGAFPSVAKRISPIGSLCQVYDANHTVNDATLTTINFHTIEEIDPLNWHDNAVNPSRVTPTIAGWYRVKVAANLVTNASTVVRFSVRAGKNGAQLLNGSIDLPLATGTTVPISANVSYPLILLNGSTDYVEMMVVQDDTGGTARAVESRMLVELVYPT